MSNTTQSAWSVFLWPVNYLLFKDESCKLIFGQNVFEIRTVVYRPEPVLEYFKMHPDQQKNSFVLVHKIPYCHQTVQEAKFSYAELNNAENLVAISTGENKDLKKSGNREITPVYVAEIIHRGEKWQKFFEDARRNNRTVTKEEIIQ
jgi:hypothetical protein